jgi:peroxiredoxin
MGQLIDMSGVGFNKRSRRYAMIVENGVINKMFIEPDASAEDVDPYGETTPENVFASL